MSQYPTYKLGEVADYINGRAFKPSEWKENGLPIVRIQNLNDESAVYHYSDAEHEEKYLLHDGDLLFAWAASLGTYIWNGGEAWLNQHIFKVLPKQNVSKMYLYYALTSIIKELYSKSHGSGMVHVTKGKFEETEIPLPPLPTQHAIVTRIETLFAELDKAVQHLRTAQQQLKTYRQAVLNHWLNNDDGKWETVKLGEVAEKIQIGPFGTQLHKSDYINGGIPLINPMHISNNKIQPDKSFSVSEEKYKELSNYYLQKDDVILGRRGEMGRCAVVSEKEDGMLCGTGSLYIRGGSAFCADYLCKLLCSQKIIMYFENASSGTTMSNLNRGIIENCEIPLPPLTEQQRIVQEIESRLSQASTSSAYIENALQQAEALRQSILKKAFSGELNL